MGPGSGAEGCSLANGFNGSKIEHLWRGAPRDLTDVEVHGAEREADDLNMA